MESSCLLVIDKSAETAERINSLLRNSGIKIRVIHAQKALNVKLALDQDPPFLILYCEADPTAANFEEVSALAGQYRIPIAIYSDLQDPADLIDTLKLSPGLVIYAEKESHLTTTVNQLLSQHNLGNVGLQQQNRLVELEHRYDLLMGSARDAMAYIHEGLHVYANRAYLEALRVSSLEEISGISLLELMQTEEGHLKKVFQGLSRGAYPQESLKVAVTRPDGTSFAANLAFSPARFHDEDCTQMLMHECDAAAGLVAELERLRKTDPLTQLHNKRSFADHLDDELAKPRTVGSVASVLYIEPDGLAEQQEDMDVSAMDSLTLDLAQVLKSCLDPQDVVARISDLGFAVLTTQASMEDIDKIAGRILEAYASHLVEIEDRSFSVTCSIGIATLGRLARNSTQILAGARKAQAEARTTGNRAITFRPQLVAVSSFEDDRPWIERIKAALKHQDFYAVQQSIIDLDGEGTRLVENLIYMHDESGDQAPNQYLAIAERSDLAGLVDRQAIPALLKLFVESSDKQIVSLSVNSILDYSFPGWLSGQMTECCVEPGKLILQINVATALANLKPVQRLMLELEPFGCKLSLSGFDAERRTRQVLEHVNAAYIKIQPALTEKLTGNTAQQELVRAIVDAAEARKVSVIADEVTDTSSLSILWQCGVKLIAGAFLKENSQVVGQ